MCHEFHLTPIEVYFIRTSNLTSHRAKMATTLQTMNTEIILMNENDLN